MALLGAVLLIGLLIAVLHLCGIRVCLFRRLTGLPCLTCGGTRALAALAVGDIAGAFRIQPLVSALLIACAAWGAANTFCLTALRRHVSVRMSLAGWIVCAVGVIALVVCNWIYVFRHG